MKPLVELLSINQRRVFWDQQLKAGDSWDPVIRSSIKQSSIFVLFWCCDTRGSEYIAKELALALLLNKKVVPVKLCAAAMPQPLSDWQWIDLRQSAQHVCLDLDHQLAGEALTVAAPRPTRSPSKKLMLSLTAVAAALLLIAVVWMGTSTSSLRFSAALPASASHAQNADSASGGGQPGIPNGAIPLREGYAMVYPPDNHNGFIVELDRQGRVAGRHVIPLGVPRASPAQVHEVELPWFYRNGKILLFAGLFALTIAVFALVIVSRRKRATATLGITIDYLHRLARETT